MQSRFLSMQTSDSLKVREVLGLLQPTICEITVLKPDISSTSQYMSETPILEAAPLQLQSTTMKRTLPS